MGIHTGQAISGDGDLFGNDINITSRIEYVAQPKTVFISDATLNNMQLS